MPPTIKAQPYVCLSCVLKTAAKNGRRAGGGRGSSRKISTCNEVSFPPERPLNTTWRRNYSSETTPSDGQRIRLSNAQLSQLGSLHKLKQRMQDGLTSVSTVEKPEHGVPIDTLLSAIKPTLDPSFGPFIGTLEQVYSGQGFDQLNSDLEKATKHRTRADSVVQDENVKQILTKLGVVRAGKRPKGEATISVEEPSKSRSSPRKMRVRRVTSRTIRRIELKDAVQTARIVRRGAKSRQQVEEDIEEDTSGKDDKTTLDANSPSKSESGQKMRIGALSKAPAAPFELDTSLISHTPIEMEDAPKVPKLSFNLSRVLFNPGVYQLQDPRSRVFNFDPYLADIMPVQQFNFDALNQYITSSEDETLRNIALQHKKRYIGSSSSMSGALSHFHFLLSAWRPVSISNLSQHIPSEVLRTFTMITRAPAAIFLRWRDGVYGIDADKEHDSGNILMILGRSMEKLLTLEKDDFEKYRIQTTEDREEPPKPSTEPEAYHYAAAGDFLLRSQLDAYDPRLPGTGMFDLKTRAVAGIRMNMDNWQHGMNYQIKDRIGLWESYEREYYDMVRAAFLKYSLQVRMGRMDGIFVAYHNIARIFGFQYIPLPELDQALHGQADQTLGDREFRTSIKLLNQIFDEATKLFPQQTLRFFFDTREATSTMPNGYMQIFAEAVSDEEVDRIQAKAKATQAEFERQALGQESESVPPSTQSPSTFESSEADVEFLNELTKEDGKPKEEDTPAPRKVASWRLTVYNEVNGKSVTRPENITSADRWNVKYKLEMRSEKETMRLYQSCKNRRAAALEPRDGDRGWFVKKLVEMSSQGKLWREQQDRLDAGKQPVVL